MANRMREDEKNEKIIRGLLKLPANRKCINCNNLGPQYVCTNFWTFICTNCSGVHREFCHRVKSISMAKFTSQEVSALQEGGNERAKEIYFKEWDPQRHSFPDSSNIDRLRNFIKHVYVDRRFTGDRNIERPPRVNVADKDESNESRRGDPYRGGLRSPSFDDRYREQPDIGRRNDDRNVKFVYAEKNTGYNQVDFRKSARRFEVVDDRRRDDRFGGGSPNRRFEERRFPDGVAKPDGSSPNRQKDVDASSPPMVRPVRDILGDDAPQLRVGYSPKSNGCRVPDNSAQTQRTLSSSSMSSSEGSSAQLKRVNSGSLIDFSADSEPPVATTEQQSIPQQTTSPPSSCGDWASFYVAGQQKAPQVAADSGTLDSLLTQLSAPVSAPAGNMSSFPVSGVESSPKVNEGGQQFTPLQQQPPLFPAADSQPNNLPINSPAVGASNDQSWSSSPSRNMQGPLATSAVNPSLVASKPPEELAAGNSSLPPSVEAKHGRKELPEDLFAALYPSGPMPVSGWQTGPHSMGYGMQYPMGVAMPTVPLSPKTTNPFDLGSEPALAHSSTFPSMASLQGALPNLSGPSPLLRSSSFGNPSPGWVSPQPSFPPALSPGLYMVQQIPSNMSQQPPNNMGMMRHQGNGNHVGGGAAFGNIGLDQLSAAGYSYSSPNTPSSFSSAGGNPFG